jgi:hypothetical protein
MRREFPYDGPMGASDYHDYCKKIGKMMCADPALRKFQDDFLREAIPRAGGEWAKLRPITAKSAHTAPHSAKRGEG